MKKFFKEYFNFTKKEVYVAIVLVILIILFAFLPYVFKAKKVEPNITANKIEFQKKPSKNSYRSSSSNQEEETNNYAFDNGESKISKGLQPFYFDPNTLSKEGFEKLGLKAKTANTIINYRSKGGKFKNPEDFRKIWGLKKEDADILIPYIKIEATNSFANTKQPYSNQSISSNSNKPSVIDINTASIEDWKRLPGLGNTAYKIVKFKEKLGGFIKTEQVKETFGLSDSVYNAIQPYLQVAATPSINQLNINTASDFELSGHPYISKDIARAIVVYRNQHGKYASVQDLQRIVFLKPAILQKMQPYLKAD